MGWVAGRTATPSDDVDTRPDLAGRDVSAPAPGMKWVGDITYIRTWLGFVYLTTVLDCCTKKVVGYCMAFRHSGPRVVPSLMPWRRLLRSS